MRFHSALGDRLDDYRLIVVPALYAVSDEALEHLNGFVKNGGHVVYSFKSGFADEIVKARTTHQPGIINEACGIYYSMFVEPTNVRLKDDPFGVGEKANTVETWMELIKPITADVLAYYGHPYWGKYAAVTRNSYGRGSAIYIGCMTSAAIINRILKGAVQEAGLWGMDQELSFPVIVKTGINAAGRLIRYYFNYSGHPVSVRYPHDSCKELLEDRLVFQGQTLEIEPWGVRIFLI